MKKLIVSLMALVVATGAFAQLNFGVKVGGNLSTISGMVSEDSGLNWGDLASADASQAMKLGLNAGVYAEYMVLPLLGIQVEANFSMQGVNTEATASSSLLGVSATTNTAYKANYVTVPILAKVHFMNIRAYAGPQFGFATGFNTTTKTVTGDNTNTQDNTLEAGDYSSFDLSLVVGAQYKLTNNIGVDARYNIGMTNVFPAVKDNNGEVLTEAWGKQGVLQLGVFYEF
jgi:opacity protein-like surface antigen